MLRCDLEGKLSRVGRRLPSSGRDGVLQLRAALTEIRPLDSETCALDHKSALQLVMSFQAASYIRSLVPKLHLSNIARGLGRKARAGSF